MSVTDTAEYKAGYEDGHQDGYDLGFLTAQSESALYERELQERIKILEETASRKNGWNYILDGKQ